MASSAVCIPHHSLLQRNCEDSVRVSVAYAEQARHNLLAGHLQHLMEWLIQGTQAGTLEFGRTSQGDKGSQEAVISEPNSTEAFKMAAKRHQSKPIAAPQVSHLLS